MRNLTERYLNTIRNIRQKATLARYGALATVGVGGAIVEGFTADDLAWFRKPLGGFRAS